VFEFALEVCLILPKADVCPYPELGTAVPAALGGPYDP
jgi:hypothetical protein